MSHNMSNDMSDEVYEFFNECQIVVKIKDIREKNKQLDELEQQLKELPKKICDEIEKFTYDTYKEFGAFDATDLQHILDEIRKKYTKEQKMREIKFRGKRVCDGLWLYGNLIQSNVGNITINGTNKYCRVDPKTVGQYTGLHDKNGEEIYEGDILKYISIVLQKPIFFTVMWSGDYNYSAFVAKNDNEFYLLSDLTLSDCEIAGNIHENKLEELQ